MFLMANQSLQRRPSRMQRTNATSFHGISVVLQLLVLPHTTRATIPSEQAQVDAMSWSPHSTTSSTLRSAPETTSLELPRNETADDTAEGAMPTKGMMLVRQLHGFVLTGHHEPLLREINGGKFCVDPSGIQPPGWRLHGVMLDLETCAKIARAQQHVVGFKWGSEVYNYSAYMQIAQSENHHGQVKPRVPVQLTELYPRHTEYTCEVFMVDKWGNVPNISLDNLSSLENKTSLRGRRLMHHMSRMRPKAFHHQGMIKGKKQEIHVCLQRRAMVKFATKLVPEYWFCYMPETERAKCEDDMRGYIIEGIVVVVAAPLVIVPLSYLMQQQIQFRWALVWVTRFVMSLQFGILSIWFLLQFGLNHDIPSLGLSFLAVLLVVVGNNVALLPYECSKALACCPLLAVVYLFFLVTCPVMFLNWAPYIGPFIQLVSYGPVPVGLMGFAMEVLKDFLCPHWVECVLGRASPPLPEEIGLLSIIKRHIMVDPKQERTQVRMQRSEQQLRELEVVDAEDMEISVVASTGCFSPWWQKRYGVHCCADAVKTTMRLPRNPMRPKCGHFYESPEHLPVWAGDANGGHAPL